MYDYIYLIFKNCYCFMFLAVFIMLNLHKTDHHDITEILLKVVLNAIKQTYKSQ